MNDLNICYMCGTKENLQHYGISFKCEDCYMKGLGENRMVKIKNICNAREKELEDLRGKYLTLDEYNERLENEIEGKDIIINNLRNLVKHKEKEIKEMKNNIVEIKCCQWCEVNRLKSYKIETNIGGNVLIKNVLEEDCDVCKLVNKVLKPEIEIEIEIEEEKFVDSWVLSYKVEGMNESIIQHHLTKEECEIIYGNMNNITYWFMEKMK